jgi:hypothetical protein
MLSITFDVDHLLEGVSYSIFKSDPDADTIFKEAVAASVDSINADDITINDVVDGSYRRYLRDNLNYSQLYDMKSRQLLTSATKVLYTISVQATKGGFSTPSDAYTSATSALQTAVTNNVFSQNLQTIALSYNNNVFQNITTSVLNSLGSYELVYDRTYAPTEVPTRSPTEFDFTTTDEFIVVMTMAFIGFPLTIVILYFLYRNRHGIYQKIPFATKYKRREEFQMDGVKVAIPSTAVELSELYRTHGDESLTRSDELELYKKTKSKVKFMTEKEETKEAATDVDLDFENFPDLNDLDNPHTLMQLWIAAASIND